MKKIIVSFILSIVALSGYSQLIVSEDGSTEVNTSSNAEYGLKSRNSKIGLQGESGGNASGWSYGVYGVSTGFYSQHSVGVAGIVPATSTYPGNYSYGVLGEAQSGENGCNYGVFARLGSQSKYGSGYALYATVDPNDNGEMSAQRYAGFFNGNVYMTGILTVRGSIISETSTYQLAISESEDAISTVGESEEGMLDKISSLNAATMYEKGHDVVQNESSAVSKANTNAVGNQPRKHYSLMADQVEELFPDLVYTKDSGEKYINYTELIPILIQSIAELRSEVATLKGNGTVRVLSEQTTANNISEIVSPHNELTIDVPVNVKNAVLAVYDANGKVVFKQTLSQVGKQTIPLPFHSLQNGSYICNLTTNGTTISTQKILLSKH